MPVPEWNGIQELCSRTQRHTNSAKVDYLKHLLVLVETTCETRTSRAIECNTSCRYSKHQDIGSKDGERVVRSDKLSITELNRSEQNWWDIDTAQHRPLGSLVAWFARLLLSSANGVPLPSLFSLIRFRRSVVSTRNGYTGCALL